jgi:hypothetical protein
MEILINYNNIKSSYFIKMNKDIFFFFKLVRINSNNKLNSTSLINYNYFLFIRILRQFGLCKSLKNLVDYR